MLNLTPADFDNKKIPALLRANFGKPGGAELRSYLKQQHQWFLLFAEGFHEKSCPLFYMLVEPPKNRHSVSSAAFLFLRRLRGRATEQI
jgi:hypothetical protein